MNFRKHSEKLTGVHAFLGASKYSWVNYDEDKLIEVYKNYQAAQKGTKLHEIAKQLIEEGIKLPKNKKTLNMYVNDAIGYRMTPEQILLYSDNCFGTADAICFNESTGLLRIHDLKTGVTPAKHTQLRIYSALFCLEYSYAPEELIFENRIYQCNDINVDNPTAEEILPIIAKIVRFDEIIADLQERDA